MNKMLKHSLSIGFIAAAPLAAADTALHCTTIQDNATRLACYDNIYSAQLPSIPTAASANRNRQNTS